VGITLDVVPVLGGEEPDNAVFRIWGGDPRLDEPPAPTPVDPELSAQFRAEVIQRIIACADWLREDDERTTYLWIPEYAWQVEVNRDDITLRARGGPTETEVDLDEALLGIFRDLDCMLVYENASEWVRLREVPDLTFIG
jgi:hypothetical protein